MDIASLSQLKKELSTLSLEELREVCIRVVKHKKENKELLHYLIFEAGDEESYILAIKEVIDEGMAGMNMANLYWAKKSIRKILRTINKYIKFSGQKQTEVELRIYFCQAIKKSGLKFYKSQALLNLYNRQVEMIQKALQTLHEDLQFDYEGELEELSINS